MSKRFPAFWLFAIFFSSILTAQDYYTAFVGSFVNARPQDFVEARDLGFIYTQVNADQLEEVQQLAVRCHELLVCDGLSRTDMIVTDAGPVVLETNSIPGLTSNSLFPRAAAAAGLTKVATPSESSP